MIPRVALVMLFVIGSLTAQILTVPQTPIAPGGQLPITVYNNGSSPMALSFYVLTGTGDLVAPRLPGCADGNPALSPGQSHSTYLVVPATGPGSSGTHLLYFLDSSGLTSAVARFHVGSITASFPSIHAFPQLTYPFQMHRVSFGYPTTTPWAIANSGASTVTFGGSDRIEIVPPGGAPAVIQSLAGLSVAPGAVAAVTLPIAGLAPGPYSARTVWQDPVQGQLVMTTGVREGPNVEMHLPTGRVLPVGGSLTAFLNVSYPNPVVTTAPVTYAFCAGLTSGTFALPGGKLIPLVNEPVVIYSVTNSLFGLLVNNVGVATDVSSPNCGARFTTNDITVLHPNLPAYAGTEVHVAAVAFSYALGTFTPSQGATIVVQ